MPFFRILFFTLGGVVNSTLHTSCRLVEMDSAATSDWNSQMQKKRNVTWTSWILQADAGLNSCVLCYHCWLNYGKFGRYAALLPASRHHMWRWWRWINDAQPSRPFRNARLDRIRTLSLGFPSHLIGRTDGCLLAFLTISAIICKLLP